MADDLSAPLGQNAPKKRPYRLPAVAPHVVAAVLALSLAAFFGWALTGDNPLGGEPTAVVTLDVRAPGAKQADEAAGPSGPRRYDGPGAAGAPADAAPAPGAPPGTRTITLIDGSTGKRQEVPIPAANAVAPSAGTAGDQRVMETSRHGPIPRIGADGARPADIYAQAAPIPEAKADNPRITIVITGLGIGASGTADALGKLPGPITLAFAPYGTELERLAGRARAGGHELLLQVPMEPFDYPDNDPGPRTLLTSLTPEQNLDRLYWLMSRFQGYVGLANYMGARFTATEQALAPVLREAATRGLIYLDDGSSPRSLAAQVAGASGLAFAKADVVIDAVPTPAEIDRALTRLEGIARDQGSAVGVASALPVAVERIARWAKHVESRGILLVPISAAAAKPKQS